MIAKNLVRLGEGAGTSRAWLEPAYDLAERGQLDFLLFECLAERTIAFAQLERLAKPDAGYDPLLLTRLRGVLAPCYRQGTRILTNAGAANPPAAGRLVVDLARSLGLRGLRVGVVTGDDVLALLDLDALVASETGRPLRELEGRIVSANAYLGAGPLAEALGEGAHVVVGGRIADPCLALAALRHSFGWGESDWGLLGAGVAVGHLTECGPQVTGGYFADPGRRDVPDLAHIGYPVAECRADGTAIVTKLPGSGGLVSVATCTEQLLYEVHDPSAYFTPDVIADFSNVRFAQEGPDRVRVQGAGGLPAPATLKVAVGYRDGYIGEARLSYGGTGCLARARLAAEVLAERVRLTGVRCQELRVELLGVNSLYGDALPLPGEPPEVQVRAAVRTDTFAEADLVASLSDGLTLAGPYGGGGIFRSVREVIAIASVYLPRELVRPRVEILEV
ncbi:MAG: DUF1446 domain-containing protein [Dehalococcoidales bacterium]|nr:DUF1446 domain-containing protein [Dehalococcoidales bacterium]